MSYTKSAMPDLLPLVMGAAIAATTTIEGPVMPYAGEITGATLTAAGSHTADDGSNKFVITISVAGGSAAATFDTETTDINAESKAFPTVSTVAANRRFAAGQQITAVLTETGTAAAFAVGDTISVHVIPVYDHAISG